MMNAMAVNEEYDDADSEGQIDAWRESGMGRGEVHLQIGHSG